MNNDKLYPYRNMVELKSVTDQMIYRELFMYICIHFHSLSFTVQATFHTTIWTYTYFINDSASKIFFQGEAAIVGIILDVN